MNGLLVGILLYVALQLAIGWIVSRRIRDEEDYLVAGRRLGYSLTTLSFFATWFGAETCINSASEVYRHGLSGGSADPFGYGLCIIFLGAVFAVALWRRRLTTLADLFHQRYSRGVERAAVLLMVPTSVFWAAAQVRAFGQVLSASSDVDVTLAIVLAAAVAIAYTVMGGLRADVVTDFVQGLVIIGGLFVLLLAIVNQAGGFHAAWAGVDSGRLSLLGDGDARFLDLLETWAIPICGSVTAQELIARVAGSRSPEVAQRSALMGGGLYILIGMIPAFIGLIGVRLMPGLAEAEQILPRLAQEHLSTLVYIIFAGALVSAILSTIDSCLLAAAALVSHNLVAPLRPGLTERGKVRMARTAVVVLGAVSCLLALDAENIFELVEASSSFGGGGLFVIMVFGLFTRIGTHRSAWAALGAAVLVWVSARVFGSYDYGYITSLALAAAAYVAVAWMTQRPSTRS